MFLMIGLGERAGSGMAKIQQGWQHTGGKLALLDSVEPFDQTWLKMDFPCASDSQRHSGRVAVNVAAKMAEMVAVKVLELMTENPDITIPDIAATLGKSKRSIERTVHELKSDGKVDRAGSPRGGRWVVGNSTPTKSI
jgi:predicted HTH transcriptional regulator